MSAEGRVRFESMWSDELLSIIRRIQVDRADGLNRLRTLAEKGDKAAIEQLGLYLSEDDEEEFEALKWLTAAADFGSATAAWNIAMFHRQHGKKRAMRKFIDLAAELGEPDALEAKALNYDINAVLKKYRS